MSRKPMGKIEGATPEQVAQAIFAAATPPDPTKRKQRVRRSPTPSDEDVALMRKPPEAEKDSTGDR